MSSWGITAEVLTMPDNIDIYLSDSLSSSQRELAEQSIALAVERTRAEADAARERSAEEARLRAAITAPFADLLQADPGAAEALERLRIRRIGIADGLHTMGSPAGAGGGVFPPPPTDNWVELRRPPYDFAWNWHQAGGAPAHSQSGDRDGNLLLDARSGDPVDGADEFVSAHRGVGCIVQLDRPLALEFFVTRLSSYSYTAGAYGMGGDATSEGGFEMTFMRGNELLMAGSLPLFRKRVSGPWDEETIQTEFTAGVYPNGMGGRFDPGDYAFNVGIWAFAEHNAGPFASAGARSLVQSDIVEMRIHRRA